MKALGFRTAVLGVLVMMAGCNEREEPTFIRSASPFTNGEPFNFNGCSLTNIEAKDIEDLPIKSGPASEKDRKP